MEISLAVLPPKVGVTMALAFRSLAVCTAAGKYPLEALKMMVEIAQTTEPHLNYEDYRCV